MVIEKLVQKCKKQLKQRNDWYAGIKGKEKVEGIQ